MLLSPDLIKQRLKNLGVSADKYLGQHFLIDQTVLDTIRETVQRLKSDTDLVIEVGPGLGVLTDLLSEEMTQVVAVEKDPVFARSLESFLNKPNISITQGDILRVLETDATFPNQEKWLFVANIPYAITSPLLRMLSQRNSAPQHIVVLMQKEVAERLVAEPGNANRGLLTIQMEVVGKTTILMNVPPSSFWPEPKVDSALVHIDLTQSGLGLHDAERDHFFKIVAAGFSQKRKQIHNSLSAVLQFPSDDVKQKLLAVGIDPNRRAETLTLTEWQALSQSFK